MKKHFPALVKICIVSVYLIILAGATVRMTGSGMGCPDWPKCFGHLIPPTELDQILWKPGTSFGKGEMILKDETLYVSKQDFTSGSVFKTSAWEAYKKHDYAKFNATHTWVEYINRLFSAVSGIFFLGLILLSLKFFKENKSITFLSFFALLLMLFEAWLGKTVVDSNLASAKIGVHMLVALAIVGILLLLLIKSRISFKQKPFDRILLWLSLGVLGLTVVQVLLGIEVRQFVDEQLKELGFANKQLLVLTDENNFLVHRSLSILIVLANAWLFLRNKKLGSVYALPLYILALIGIEVLTGIVMSYLDFPFGSQASHLLIAAILFGMQFYLILQILQNKTTRSIAGSPSNA